METTNIVNSKSDPSRQGELLTATEAAQKFRIGRDKLYQLAHTVNTTGFPALWFGPKTVKFPREALQVWLNSEMGRKALFQIMKKGN
ncbi:helix-turn-helix domain-containing protein [Dehalobacter sp. TeCB1]|uniref:helix-turn-helix domain-containing protein n=1 Tax=Dehalobacter sp. TeCB1 TaxID=1843715 RepID=UPI00083B4512|nr:helix-turn-helix domain-containing protein [Dehalobacter sp. TeCB1]OCZ54232.1 hypothetical protein A7D23_05530 [Dehalobacter sp. TeCB1]